MVFGVIIFGFEGLDVEREDLWGLWVMGWWRLPEKEEVLVE